MIGVHRSGTSAVTRALECIGAAQSTRLAKSLPNNPKGFFEDEDVQQFNENQLLPLLGARWHDAAPPALASLAPPQKKKLLQIAKGYLRTNFPEHHSLVAMKDPRITTLLPFWLEAAHEAGFRVKIVAVVRDPLSVAKSLAARNGFSIAHGTLLYTSQWLCALAQLGEAPVAFIHYDDVVTDTRRTLLQLAGGLEIATPDDFDQRVDTFRQAFLDPTLRHQQFGLEELGADPEVPRIAIDLYGQLARTAAGELTPRQLQEAASPLRHVMESLAPLLSAYDASIAECSRLQRVELNYAEEVAGLERALSATEAERDKRFQLLEDEISKRDAIRSQLQTEVDGLRQRATSADETSALASAALSDFRASLTAAIGENGRLAAANASLAAQLEAERSANRADRDSAARLGAELNKRTAELALVESKLSDSLLQQSKLQASVEAEATARARERAAAEAALAHNRALSKDVSRALTAHNETMGRLASVEAELACWKESSSRLEASVREAQVGADHFRSSLNQVLQSLSWRLTGPLRWLGAVAKRDTRTLLKAAQEVRESGLFDPIYYRSVNGAACEGVEDLLMHYMEVGGIAGLNPCPSFDARFYLDTNYDVRVAGMNPLLHYLRTGRVEGRRANPRERPVERSAGAQGEAREIREIVESGYFDAEWYLEHNPDVRNEEMDPAFHYVRHGWREGRNPSPHFDTRFYLRAYGQELDGACSPLGHFLARGRARGHVPTEAHLAAAVTGADAEGAGRRLPRLTARVASAAAALKALWAPAASQAPASDADRHAMPVSYTWLRAHRDALPRGQTILFVGCDALIAGSQVLLLNMAQWLHGNTSLNLKFVLMSGGPLLPQYRDCGPVVLWNEVVARHPDSGARRAMVVRELGPVDLVYGNTVIAGAIYEDLAPLGAPFLSHIHELGESISKYVSNEALSALLRQTDEFIACSPPVGANLTDNYRVPRDRVSTVHAFIKEELIDTSLQKPALRASLGLPSRGFLVIGCGTIYWRKGVDLFVDTALELRRRGLRDCHFIWIGDHHWDQDEPSRAIASWADIAKRSGGAGGSPAVTFLGARPSARAYFQAADAFFLPSREDPFPLVCLEAAQRGTPIVCFEGSGGIPEFVGNDAGFVVTMADINAAADALERLRRDAGLRARMGAAASARLSQRHTDRVAIPQILGICRRVAKARPLVSVIVPIFNHERFLRQRIDSILCQTFQDFEVLLLDDASTDGSPGIAEQYAGHPQVTLVRNEINSGSAFKQWSKGLSMAKGEFVWIAEGDDASEPDFLRELLPFFRNPDVALAYADSQVIDEDGKALPGYKAYYEGLDPSHWAMDYEVDAATEINFGLGAKNTIPNASAVLMRRSAITPGMLERIGMMRFSGDWYLYVQVLKGRRIGFRNQALNLHRKHRSTLTHQFNQAGRAKNTILEEALAVHRFVLDNYPLTGLYRRRLGAYLREQLAALHPGLSESEQEAHYPVDATLAKVASLAERNRRQGPRIAFITTADTSHDGGSEQLWVQTALRMAASGCKVLAVIRKWEPEPYFFASFRERGVQVAFKEESPEKAIVAFRPDLVVVNIGDQDDGTDWYDSCQRHGLRYAIINHLTKEERYWPVRVDLADKVRQGNLAASRVFFTSRNNRYIQERRIGALIPHADVFHNPLFIDRTTALPFPSADGPLRVAMPARMLSIHKGQPIAIDVFAMKKWRNRPIQLHLYGNGPDEGALRSAVERHRLTNVFFHDPNWQLPKPDLAAIWRDNHALLMTSFMEGMPIVLLNAMFFGRVPIVTDIGGHREVIEDGASGFIAAQPTPEAVDHALERAWRRRQDWEAIGGRARQAMLAFSPEDPIGDMCDKLELLAMGDADGQMQERRYG